jgi:hypothetical protein
MGLRHFAPFVFLLVLIVSGGLAITGAFVSAPASILLPLPLAVVLGLHLLLGCLAGLQVSIREKSAGALWLPLVLLGFHICYGFGTLWAFLTGARAGGRK